MHGKYHEKLYFFEIFLHWFKCTNYILYDMIFFPKYNWKYNLSVVLGTVIKCPKGTGSAWEIKHNEKSCFLQAIYLQCSAHAVGIKGFSISKFKDTSHLQTDVFLLFKILL